MEFSEILDVFLLLLTGIPATVMLTLGALAIGVVGGVPVMLARRSHYKLLRVVAASYVELVRGIPPLVWIFIAFFGIPRLGISALSPAVAATIALGIVSTAYLAEIYRAGIESVPKGQWESSDSLAFSGIDQFRLIIAPQSIPLILPPAGTFAVGMIKETALASIIGVTEITFLAYIQAQRTYEGLTIFAIAALVYIIICIPAAAATRRLDSSVSKQSKRLVLV